MELVGTVVNAFVVAAVGLLLGWLANARFREMRREMNRRFDGVDRRFEEMERRMDSFQGSLDSMRSDLTQVALAVGAGRRASGAER